ncbi:MAG: phosphoribosylglycinamide formyltransferase [Pirellula sp.]|jgi:phosphoribosylglycinamide formyltransferase-1|nr:phosphoribosylglycinamide formyltransferase [Pirellula sp.]
MSLPIAVLISGGGSTLKNLIDRRDANRLDIDIRFVVSSRSDAGGLQHAAAANIPTIVVPKKKSIAADLHSEAIFQPIRQSGAKLVVMGGFLQHVLIPPDFENRVINIHPSLIPAFCGQGMYGLRVHEAAISFGVKISGCTVHYVDNQYDHGPIILQKACEVFEQDTALDLQKRVLQLEYEALPEAIAKIAPRF